MTDIQAPVTDTARTSRQPIARVRVFSTGSAEQHREHRYGSRLPQLWWVFFGRSWVPLPLQFFLIEHRDGPILFDTGIDPAIQTDKGYIGQAVGRFLLTRIFRFNITNQDRVDKLLDKAGVAADDIG